MLMEHLPDGLEIDGLEVSDEVISDGDAHVRLGRYEGQAVAIAGLSYGGIATSPLHSSARRRLNLSQLFAIGKNLVARGGGRGSWSDTSDRCQIVASCDGRLVSEDRCCI